MNVRFHYISLLHPWKSWSSAFGSCFHSHFFSLVRVFLHRLSLLKRHLLPCCSTLQSHSRPVHFEINEIKCSYEHKHTNRERRKKRTSFLCSNLCLYCAKYRAWRWCDFFVWSNKAHCKVKREYGNPYHAFYVATKHEK